MNRAVDDRWAELPAVLADIETALTRQLELAGQGRYEAVSGLISTVAERLGHLSSAPAHVLLPHAPRITRIRQLSQEP